jgi:CubicO group peptidase (beta-lactamase class C family)
MTSRAIERLDGEVLGGLCETIEAEVAAGLDGAEFAIALDGELVFAQGFGEASADTPIAMYQLSRTVFDSALWLLIGDGSVDLDAPVATYVPQFGANGKEAVTVRQLMTHTGGFALPEFDWPMWRTRGERLAAYERFRQDHEPGAVYEFQPAAGPWALADVIHAVTGQDHREFLRSRVLEPLGLLGVRKVSLGEPLERQHEVLTHRFDLPAEMLPSLPPHVRGPDGKMHPPAGLALPEGREVGFPGGAVGSAGGLAVLYQAYLGNPGHLWDENVLRMATREVAIEHDDRWGRPIRRSLSMYLAGDPSLRPGAETEFFGQSVSPAAFGHDGLGGNFAWADPATGASVAFLTNTITFVPVQHHDRATRLSTLAGRAVG